jgi:hypothetical protein
MAPTHPTQSPAQASLQRYQEENLHFHGFRLSSAEVLTVDRMGA